MADREVRFKDVWFDPKWWGCGLVDGQIVETYRFRDEHGVSPLYRVRGQTDEGVATRAEHYINIITACDAGVAMRWLAGLYSYAEWVNAQQTLERAMHVEGARDIFDAENDMDDHFQSVWTWA